MSKVYKDNPIEAQLVKTYFMRVTERVSPELGREGK